MFQIIILFLFISDSFVNSQEWTLSRGVPDIRLGIVGSLSSGKSALVHRYLTGTSFASPILSKMPFSETIYFNEEKILKGSLDLIPSPSPSVEIQIIDQKFYFWGNEATNFLFSKVCWQRPVVLPLHLKQTFPFIIWISTEGEGDGIKSRLSS